MKSEEEVIHKAKELIEASKVGSEKESPKIDFKFTWYKLKTKYGKNEFTRDMASIANTVGLDGYIIIGFDENNKQSKNAPFEDCGLNDTADVTNLLIGKLSHLFQFQIVGFDHQGTKFHVIHIPPTFNKPIVVPKYSKCKPNDELIRDFKQQIFLRNNTRTTIASKYDLDFMYYDNKNIIPDYDFKVDAINFKLEHWSEKNTEQAVLFFTIENIGRRPIAIKSMMIQLKSEDQIYHYELKGKVNRQVGFYNWTNQSLIIKPNEIEYITDYVFYRSIQDVSELLGDAYTKPVLVLTSLNGEKHKIKINLNNAI